jgi:hypothetical protein
MLKKEWSCNMLKYSLEVNLIPFLQTTKKKKQKPSHQREKAFIPISNGLRKGVGQNYLNLIPSIKRATIQ